MATAGNHETHRVKKLKTGVEICCLWLYSLLAKDLMRK